MVEHGVADRAVDESEFVDAAVVVDRDADAEVLGDVVGGEAEPGSEHADGDIGTRCRGMSTRRGYLLRMIVAISCIDTISGRARMQRPEMVGSLGQRPWVSASCGETSSGVP